LSLFPESSDKDVGRDVSTQMTYMALAVSVWKTAGDKDWLVGWEVGHGRLT